jgi:hypothetical protein
MQRIQVIQEVQRLYPVSIATLFPGMKVSSVRFEYNSKEHNKSRYNHKKISDNLETRPESDSAKPEEKVYLFVVCLATLFQ